MAWVGVGGRLEGEIKWMGWSSERLDVFGKVINLNKLQLIHQEDPLEKGKSTHSSVLAWRIPWIV